VEHFARFYYEGGGFMHLVSLSFLAALACSIAGLRRLGQDGEFAGRGLVTLRLGRSLRALCLGIGVLGTLTLAISVLQAVAAGAAEEPLRYAAMALHPLLWALGLLLPLSLGVAVRRHRSLQRSHTLLARETALAG
jgi:hypothetical protein